MENAKKEKTNYGEVKKLVITAIFAALAIVIGYIEIPFPPLPFLKLDFSEVVILISLITLGFNRTVIVILLRSGVRWTISSGNTDIPFPFFGELLAITASIVIISSATLAFKLTKTAQTPLFLEDKKERVLTQISLKKQCIHAIIIITVFTAFMTALNAFITFPAMLTAGEHYFVTSVFKAGITDGYFASVKTYLNVMFFAVAPFNILKGLLTMIVFSLLHGRIAQMEV